MMLGGEATAAAPADDGYAAALADDGYEDGACAVPSINNAEHTNTYSDFLITNFLFGQQHMVNPQRPTQGVELGDIL